MKDKIRPVIGNLQEILHQGDLITIKHPEIVDSIITVLQKTEASNIYFRVPEEFLHYNIMIGEKLTCQVLKGKFEYVLNGQLLSIQANYPRIATFIVDDIKRYPNKRKEKRYKVSIPSSVFIPQFEKKVYSIIKNISRSGISAMVGLVFIEDISTEIMVKLEVSAYLSKKETLKFKARLVRSSRFETYNEFGMEIVEIDDENRDLLDKILYDLEKNEKVFIAEWAK